jgi:hypothetical protein
MAKIGKRTKKFQKKHLDGELRRRRATKIKKQREATATRRALARGRESDDEDGACRAMTRGAATRGWMGEDECMNAWTDGFPGGTQTTGTTGTRRMRTRRRRWTGRNGSRTCRSMSF